jgi:hypothetical protein
LPYRFVTGLALHTWVTAFVIYILLRAATVLWIYIRHYPERPPPRFWDAVATATSASLVPAANWQ